MRPEIAETAQPIGPHMKLLGRTHTHACASPTAVLACAVEHIKLLPLIRGLQDRRHYAHFLSAQGFASHYGVFGSFDEARKRLPVSREFDQPQLTAEYVDIRMHRVYPYDYPVIYWLSRALADGATSVFDIGGSVGVHYYAYEKFLSYPDDMLWIVCETPAVAQVGRAIAAQRARSELTFLTALEPSNIKADVWLSCGALQYIEDARPKRLLAQCGQRPKQIIFNKLPLYDGDDFVVAQNIGSRSYAPAYIYNKAQFINEIESMGYRLVDSWQVLDRTFYLPDHPEKCFKCFSGLCFRMSGHAHH